MPELKAAIVRKFKRENNLDYKPNQISVGTGGKQVIYNALLATLNPGDEVVIPAPCWVSYADIVMLAGAQARVRRDQARGRLPAEAGGARSAITPKTKWLIFNSPSNPTGAAYSKAEIKALTDVLLKHQHVWVMTDDIYEHLLYDGLKFAHRRRGRAGAVRSHADHERPVEGLLHDRLAPRLCRRPGAADQRHAQAAVAVDVEPVLDHAVRRRSRRWTARRTSSPRTTPSSSSAATSSCRCSTRRTACSCPKPEGAFYVYPSCAGAIGKTSASGKTIANDEDFATALLEEEGVAVVHGAAFAGSPAFRVSYATSKEVLEEACRRIQRFCGNLR